MIQKNIYFPPAIGGHIALVARARRMQLSELHDQIVSTWLNTSPALDIEECGETPERLPVYLSEQTYDLLLKRLVALQLEPRPGTNRSRITETDLIRSALIWWLRSLALDAPLPNHGLDE